ncbi:MAG: hypothetical protein Ct9H300mP16_10880 [Pseudomonadota bacterium]|nr:MAG: hypothetical protein Ct9H300mP16_10880 [Pseudomonadota bacterium]
MNTNSLPRWLQPRLPFFYGWVVLSCVCCAGFARQGPAVATLSIFIEPMTEEFGWSRTAMSVAVSMAEFWLRWRLPYWVRFRIVMVLAECYARLSGDRGCRHGAFHDLVLAGLCAALLVAR